MPDDVFSTGQQLVPELMRHFQISPLLLSGVYRRPNGFFTFEESLAEDGELQVYCV
jgi:hypothetical protein